MTRFALFRDDSTGVINDGDGNTVNGVPDPTSEGDVLKVVLGVWAGAAPGGGGGGGGGIGASELIYRYTVTGSDKASIDTGVDTPDAGSNDWSNGDLLEVFLYSRTDDAVNESSISWRLNNDASSVYDLVWIDDVNATVSGNNSLAQSKWALGTAGASLAAGVFGLAEMRMANYLGTVGNKTAMLKIAEPSQSATSAKIVDFAGEYRSTAAITRLAVAPAVVGKKLKVGSQLLIYKRLAS